MESGTPGFGMPSAASSDAERIGAEADALLSAGGDHCEDAARCRCRRCSRPTSSCTMMRSPTTRCIWLRTTIDGKVFPRRSAHACSTKAPAKPVIIGSNRFEFGLASAERPRSRSSPRRSVARAARRAPSTMPISPTRRRSAPRHARRADRHRRHLPLPGRSSSRSSWPRKARRSGTTSSMPHRRRQDLARGRDLLRIRRFEASRTGCR